MLDGEIAYREGRFDDAFASLRKAIELDDALPYDEPWGWMQPTRHAYGALLLEQGRVEEAAAVYAADLGLDSTLSRPCQHPGNVWSLHGYHECLNLLGRNAEAVDHRPSARTGPRPCRRADPGVVRVPVGGRRRLLRLSPSAERDALQPEVDKSGRLTNSTGERAYPEYSEVRSPAGLTSTCRARLRRRCRPPRSAGRSDQLWSSARRG